MSKLSFPSFLLFFIFLSQHSVLGQALFEKGFYIDHSNNRYEGYIDRTNLSSDQIFIDFKTSKKSDPIRLTPEKASEIFVSGIQLKSYSVFIDTTAFGVSSKREPSFDKKNVFLFGLVDGEISLLEYKTEEASLYFVQEQPDRTPYQLVYKRYLLLNGKLYNNNTYIDQLDSLILSLDIKMTTDQVIYTRANLIKFIKEINSAKEFSFKDYSNPSLLSARYLNIVAISGFRFNHITSKETITEDIFFSWEDASLSNFGLELELLLPSLENQFSFIGRSELASGTRSDSVLFTSGTQQVKANINYMLLSLGIRWYLPVSNTAKFYADFGISKPIMVGNGIQIKHETRPNFRYQKKNLTPSFGIGVSAFNRFSLESRLEFLDATLSKNDEFDNITYTAFTLNLKVFLKSYYSVWDK